MLSAYCVPEMISEWCVVDIWFTMQTLNVVTTDDT